MISVNSLFQWLKTNSSLLSNAASLVGSTGVTSVLGFAYWWLAARQFSPAAVGFASAALSAMTLLGTFGILGLGTLLVGELPRHKGLEAPIISTALILVGGVSLVLGCIFAFFASYISPNLQSLGTDAGNVIQFALGVSFTAITLVLDQALIGILQGGLQLWRNALFAGVKLTALFILGLWLTKATGLTLYATWTVGNVVSLLALAGVALRKGIRPGKNLLPQFRFLHKLGLEAIKHHALNLTLQAPTLLLPIIVTIALSTTMNAWFYIAWNLSSLGNIIAYSLTVALYAVSAAQPWVLARKLRLTLGLAFASCALITLVFLFGTQQVLSFFGHNYAEQAAWSLRILSVEALPFIIKTHYVAIRRIHGQVAPATLITIATGLLEVGGATLGVYLGGLTGLSLGWFSAMCIEAACMLPAVYQSARITQHNLPEARAGLFAADLTNLDASVNTKPAWLVDTIIQPAWLVDTFTLNAIVLPKQMVQESSMPGEESERPLSLRPTLRPIRLTTLARYDNEETVKLERIKVHVRRE